ncbi:MAG TPA: helix-turn-helix transcriptional regulator [Actinophytocola sp.]|uniref:helix-turn-helix domain-containing protein n=1 Tax=Actinophytocola sp. TaxID=1872138 RepID=UPI002DDD731B|nr:helix-turn-helix transcriptional regulator [Actinophytocola sp.]HEV2783716.1 helix-turn-helix transcriptional regulator [Actinophytocola sp.]
MTTTRTPSILRRRLGRKLKRMREAAGLSLEEAALRLEKTRSSLHRAEHGKSRVDVHLARSMMDLYDQWDGDLLDDVREALKPRWYQTYSPRDMGYVDLETEAVSVREFAVFTLPGLLQTEAYMRELFRTSGLRRTPEQFENDVKVRLIRQRRLSGDDEPLELAIVIDESALRREVGGPEVMRAQLRQVVAAAALPTVTVQVLPLRGAPYGAVQGAFVLLSFPEPDEPDMQYVSYSTGSLHIEDQTEVYAARLLFDRLRSEALGPADSLALIERVSAELYGA